MSKTKQPKIPITVTKGRRKGTLTRKRDNLTKHGTIATIEWKEDNTAKAVHGYEPTIGYSVIVDVERGVAFTWQTTPITLIAEVGEDEYVFHTGNSVYRLKMDAI